MQNRSQSPQPQKPSGIEYNCPICKDTGVTIIRQGSEIPGNEIVNEYDFNGHHIVHWKDDPVYGECQCVKRARMENLFKDSMIPDEFKEAQFTNFRQDEPWQKNMYGWIVDYLKDFESIKNSKSNSFGFIASYGEQNIRNLPTAADKAQAKADHNSFGIGKTHLEVAAAKRLIKRAYGVLVVSDAILMDDLVQAKMLNDSGTRLRQLLNGTEQADVLIWDDIGKAKPSEAKENLYYQIVDSRYRARRPIIFSSNEDKVTLAERIGQATADRLISGMAYGRVYEVEGPSQRGKE